MDVLRLLVFEGMRPTLLGVTIGLAATAAVSRVLATLIFGVEPLDAPTFLSGSVILVGIGFVASLMPAYRATRADPLRTLRDE
jgi:putative ABC transport system permease protein